MIVQRARLATIAGCAAGLLLSMFAGAANAQTPDAAPAEPVRWQGNAVVSVQVQSGVTDQRTVSVSGEAFRRASGWSYSIQADHTYASVKLGPDFQTVAESQNARFTVARDLNDVFHVVVRPAFKRNEVQAVDYRFEGLAGIGARLVRHARGQVDVIGVGGFVTQQKNVPEIDGTSAQAGVVQTSQFALSQVWRVSELAVFLRPLEDSEDYRMQFQTSLTGAIAGPIALSVSYTLDRENLVLGGSNTTDRRLSLGVQVNF